MPKVYVLVGVPGSGKSTWILNQEWSSDTVVVSSDRFIDNHAAKQGLTYNDVFKDYVNEAISLMFDQVIEAREAGKDIIWDQTSVSVKSRKRKFQMLPDYEHIAVVFNTPPADELTKRLASRPGKSIPWEIVSSMIDNFEMPTEKEGYKEIWRT